MLLLGRLFSDDGLADIDVNVSGSELLSDCTFPAESSTGTQGVATEVKCVLISIKMQGLCDHRRRLCVRSTR